MFGQNDVYRVRNFENNDKLLIRDIFYTLQGEGPLTGIPAVFIRLARCSLKCSFCIEENQRVLMADYSYKAIKDLNIGDYILGLEKSIDSGYLYYRKQKVLNKINTGSKNLLTLNTKYCSLKSTDDHKILISQYRNRFLQAKSCKNKPIYTTRFGDITNEFKRGWLAGYADGDGNFHKFKKRWLRFKATSRDVELLDTFIQWSLDLKYTIPLRKITHNAGTTNNLGDYDGKINGIECTQYKEVEVFQSKIMEYDINSDNSDYLRGYISGFFDAEGTITYDTDIRIAQENSKNIKKLNKIKFALDECDIKYSIQKSTQNENITVLAIANVAEFISYIQPQCIRKRNAFNYDKVTNTACYKDIVNIKNEYETGVTYDITTELGNFICEGFTVHNCDTDFDNDTQYLSVNEIVEKTKELLPSHADLVVITGGEPLLQKLCGNLIKELLRINLSIQIETSGSVCAIDFNQVEFITPKFNIVCSPKTGKLDPKIIDHINYYKYVIKHGELDFTDGLPFKLARPPSDMGLDNIYISPMDEYDEEKNKLNLKTVAEISMKYGYRVSLQAHKYLMVE